MTESIAAQRLKTSLKVVDAKSLFGRIRQIHESIARRAFEIFESNGASWGHDLDNWFRRKQSCFILST